MLNIKAIALASVLALSAGAGSAYAAQSAMDALTSASTVSFATLSPTELVDARAGNGKFEQVDLESLRARISNDPQILMQLADYGAGIDDVVGISGTSEKDVTVYVRG
jgi:hypothetical protein